MKTSTWLARGAAGAAAAVAALFISERLAGAVRDLLGPLLSLDDALRLERALLVAFSAPGLLALLAVALYGAAARLRGPDGPDELADQDALVTAAGTALFFGGRAGWLVVLSVPGAVVLPHLGGRILIGAAVTVWFLAGGATLRAWLREPNLAQALSPRVLPGAAQDWDSLDAMVAIAAGGLCAALIPLPLASTLGLVGVLEMASLGWATRRPLEAGDDA